MNELISIIVPVYNTKKYLKRCIRTILEQTYSNLEVILVDDGSSDGSGKICDEFAKKDNRVVVVHKENEGQGVARNIALDIARGDLIGFVDSDDYILPDMYMSLYSAMKQYNADISMCAVTNDHIIKKTAMHTLPNPKTYNTEELLVSYISEPFVRAIIMNKLFKKELWEEIRFSKISAREDEQLLYKVYSRCNKAVHIGTAKYIQFIRPNSLEQSEFSDAKLSTIESTRNIKEYVISNYPDSAIYTELWMARAYFGTMEDIATSSNYKEYMVSYYEIKQRLADDLNRIKQQVKNIDANAYERFCEPINNEKLFLKKCRKNCYKHNFINCIKKIILLFTDYK